MLALENLNADHLIRYVLADLKLLSKRVSSEVFLVRICILRVFFLNFKLLMFPCRGQMNISK